jgi:arginyl-tRNA synthetase
MQLAKSRKILFWAARTALHNALKLLGLIPLTRM